MKTIAATNARDLSTEPRTPAEHAACASEMHAFIEAHRPAIESIAKALEAGGCRVQLRISGRPGGHEVQFAASGAA